MVTATTEKTNNRPETTLRVDHLINRGDWFGETWLIEIPMGFEALCLVVEAGNASDAMDTYADSKYAHLTKLDADEPVEEWHTHLGNAGDLHNIETVRVAKCSVNYFAKKAD